MAEIVNLRKARKQRNRALEVARAAENRVRHGRTKSEKLADRNMVEKAEQALDRAKLQD